MTSVEVLEQMGEETDGVIESTSKLQEKIKALSGVDILSETGEYRNTYEILKDIALVYEDMESMDQAALIELVAGKNRANTLAAILTNFEDLEGAYESALNAEGSALKENEAYLDSIQGRIDLFNNSLQTMWMNTLNSEVVKFVVNLGTNIIDLVDKLGLFKTAFAGILTYLNVSSKHKLDFASMLGLYDLENSKFSFGKNGLTGWIVEKFKSKKNTNIIDTVLGDKEDIKVSIEDFASAIQDNINNYITIDTSEVDTAIDSVQQKLEVARQQLEDAKTRDWNYYKSLGSTTPAKDRDNSVSEKIQEIESLEAKLTDLQVKRNEIVSDATNNVAASMIGSINNETQAYTSMLSVLAEVKDMKLSLGDEQDAAKKIDQISLAAQNGQTALADYVATLDDGDIALKAYVASVEDGNYSLAGFQQFIAQHNAGIKESGVAAKAAAVGHQLLNTAISMGISLGISALISLFVKLANAEKDAAEAAREAADASKELREQNESLEDYKEQIIELRKELDSNTLSESDAYDAREKLLTIQNELIEKFGLEKDGLDLVTGAINDQISAIDKLSQQNAQQWLNNNQKSINEAIKFFDSDSQGSKLDSLLEGKITAITNWGVTKNVSDMIDAYTESHDNIASSVSKGFGQEQDIFFTGSVEEAKAAVEDFQNWLSEKQGEMQSDLSKLTSLPESEKTDDVKNKIKSLQADLDQLQDVYEDIGLEVENWFGENSTYASNKAIIEEAQYNTAITQYADEYTKILQAQNDLAEAQVKGDQDAINKALETINSETSAAAATAKTNGQSYMVNFFNGIQDEYKELSNEMKFKIDLSENILFGDTQKGIKEVLSEALSDLEGMNAKEIIQLGEIEPDNAAFVSLKSIADEYNMSIEDLCNSLVKLKYIQSSFADDDIESIRSTVDTYSTILESIENYNDIVSQTSEIILNNTEVTEDYKEALQELGISEDELNECFYESNPLIVKNASKLKSLVKSTKSNTAQNIKLAKSQARLQYAQLYQKMQQLTNGKKVENAATLAQVNAIYQEMSALQKTIAKYSLLEQKLLGASNAYDQLAEAQEIDSETDYGSKAEELVNVLAEAFNTAELGTEAAQVAISGLIPDDVIDKSKTLDEQMQQIYDYFTGGEVSKLFTIEFDDDGGISSVEMTKENIESYVNKLLKTDYVNESGKNLGSIFSGTWDEFDLNPAITSLEEFADACGLTEEVAFAFLTSLEKYDISWLGGDMSTLLDQLMGDDLEYQMQKNTEAMADLEYQVANGKISVAEYEKEMGGLNWQLNSGAITQQEYDSAVADLNQQLDNGTISLTEYTKAVEGLKGVQEQNAEAAVQSVTDWANANSEVDNLTQQVKTLTSELNSLKASNADPVEIQAKTDELQEASNKLSEALKKKYSLEEPTEMVIQVALEQANQEIEQFKAENSVLLTKVQIEKDENGNHSYTVNAGVSLSDEEKAKVDAYMKSLDNQYTVTVLADDNPEDSTAELKEVKSAAEAANEAIENIEDPKIDAQPAITAINELQTAINNIKGTTVDIYETTHKKTVYSWGIGDSSGGQSVNGTAHLSGTAHAQGTAFKAGSWGAKKTETALVGELGPEIIVDPQSGRWHTVGDQGAEFTQVKRGSIIFNHKQTEELLKNGYVTGRGKIQGGNSAFVSGTAYAGINTWDNAYGKVYKDYGNTSSSSDLSSAASDLSDAASDLSDAADEFEETFDWVEIRLEEINEKLDLMNAQLENAVGYTNQNKIIDNMLDVNNTKLTNLQAGLKVYENYANKLLKEIPSKYRKAAQDGSIAITEFAGKADEATVEAINNYREWAEKVADLTQQIEELEAEIAELAKQKFDNVSNEYDNVVGLIENANEKLDAQISLMEDRGYVASKNYYQAMMVNTQKQSAELIKERDALQSVLDEQVKLGNIKVGSDAWYEMVEQLYEVDAAIVECTSDIEEYQNAINDIYWDNFDELINRLDYLKDETQNLIDLMENSSDLVSTPEGKKYEGGTKEYWTADDVEWTDEGITSLGLYAQQMEIAEYQARQYQEAIDDLNKDYALGKYSETEYLEKLNELKSAQYDSIETYYDAQDAIVELNETRIDAIKDGIEREIDAYEELISKKLEDLEAEKDLYDFQKSVSEQQKDIASIQRKLAALSGDNSASAIAKRKQLEAELAEAQYELEESYYDRSVDQKQEALDKELEDFQNEKDAEIEKWEEYLDNVEQVVADSLLTVQNNASTVYDTLNAKADEYNLTLSNAILTPWKDGALAVSDYQTTFDTAMSSTMDQLEAMKMKWQAVIDLMTIAAGIEIKTQKDQNDRYTQATYEEPKVESKPTTTPKKDTTKAITVGGKINAGSAKIYATSSGTGGGKQYYANDPVYVVLAEQNGYVKVRHHSLKSGVSGWFKKSSVKALASGTKKLEKSGIVNIDELGEELVLRAQNGRLTYLEKGSGVIPADMTSNLMEWGKLDPTSMLEQNRPSITPSKSVINTEINIDCSVAELVHIEHCDQNTLPDVEKIVNKALDKHMQNLNNSLRKYTR